MIMNNTIQVWLKEYKHKYTVMNIVLIIIGV